MLLLVSLAAGIDEFHGYGVNEFIASDECCGSTSNDVYIWPQTVNGECPEESTSSGYNLQYAVAQSAVIDNVFDDWQFFGLWDESRDYGDQAVDPADFADPDEASWGGDGVDIHGIDDADVAYVSSHGSQVCHSGNQDFHSFFRMGDVHSGQDCSPETYDDTTFGQVVIGDEDLEIFVADTCNSVQNCVWDGNGYNSLDGTNLRMIAGYNGLSIDTVAQRDAAFAYFDATRVSGAGDLWLDMRYISNYDGTNDQCPVTLVYGASNSANSDFFNNAGMADRINTGTHAVITRTRLSGCAPADGS